MRAPMAKQATLMTMVQVMIVPSMSEKLQEGGVYGLTP